MLSMQALWMRRNPLNASNGIQLLGDQDNTNQGVKANTWFDISTWSNLSDEMKAPATPMSALLEATKSITPYVGLGNGHIVWINC